MRLPWNTQTFIAALRHDRLDAPWVIKGAMNRDLFNAYIETQLAPTLRCGDVVILDNLATHKSAHAAEVLKSVGAWFLFLPPYSPDLNPIEMAFSKLKALIRKAAARSYHALWQAVGHVCNLVLCRTRLSCDTGATARQAIYGGQWRGTDRCNLGHSGPLKSLITLVFSFDLDGYMGFGPA